MTYKVSEEGNISTVFLNGEIDMDVTEKAKEVGKPEEMLVKIAEGSVNKFLKEATLLNQSFVKDEKVTIETLLKNNNAKIHSFHIYIVGDGIEKKEMDFASEVAAVSKA